MSINFRDEVLKRKDQLLQDLTKIIQINSEMTTFDPNRKNAPFGEGLKEALDCMLAIGKRDGFETVNVDGYAGHIEFGKQKDFVGIIGHLDVVPAGNDWTYAPYGAEIHDGKMYGRGTEDDKGPTIAAYYAMKILKELNVPLSKRVKLIVGNDEETACNLWGDWSAGSCTHPRKDMGSRRRVPWSVESLPGENGEAEERELAARRSVHCGWRTGID